jgi:hypothetical protein
MCVCVIVMYACLPIFLSFCLSVSTCLSMCVCTAPLYLLVCMLVCSRLSIALCRANAGFSVLYRQALLALAPLLSFPFLYLSLSLSLLTRSLRGELHRIPSWSLQLECPHPSLGKHIHTNTHTHKHTHTDSQTYIRT